MQTDMKNAGRDVHVSPTDMENIGPARISDCTIKKKTLLKKTHKKISLEFFKKQFCISRFISGIQLIIQTKPKLRFSDKQ